jgi:LPXTG-site transpeptidase (sortase) family protein
MRVLKQIFSWMMIAGGSFLLFLGARDFLDSRFGQTEAEREFHGLGPNEHLPRLLPGDTFAKLTIPRLGTELYVVEGDDASELRRAPGHLTGSAQPGGSGNCIIAGHRDTHFRVLKDIRPGDDIVVETRAGEFLYRVKHTEVVAPDNTAPLQDGAHPELSLITCYPFYYVGSAPKRFVVEARLAGEVTTAREAASRERASSF